MAVTFDAVATGSTLATSLTFAHAVSTAGTNRGLFVGVSIDGDGGSPVTASYAGTAMTLIATKKWSGNVIASRLFGLVSPAMGTNNVVVAGLSTATAIIAGSVSVTGMDQTTGWRTGATNASASTAATATPNVSTTSASGELIIGNVAWGLSGNLPTATANQTQRWTNVTQTNLTAGGGATAVGSTATAISWVLSSAQNWSIVGVSALAAAVTSVDLNRANFTWTASTTDATHGAPTSYTVKAGTATGGPYTLLKSVTGSPLPTTLPVNQVVTTTGTYFSVVTASNVYGESGNSNEVSFIVGLAPQFPSGLSFTIAST